MLLLCFAVVLSAYYTSCYDSDYDLGGACVLSG